MKIKSVTVHNFRSILDGKIECDSLTALVGKNGAGRSSFLNAIALFYSQTPELTGEDFYDRNVDTPIEIAVTFTESSACFKEELETTMRQEIGNDLFWRLVDEYKEKFGMTKRKDAIKNPALLSRVITAARKEECASPTLEKIVEFIFKLRS